MISAHTIEDVQSYTPPESLSNISIILQWGILLLIPILLIVYWFKTKKTPFMVISIMMIILLFANTSVNIIINILCAIHEKQNSILTDNGLYYFHGFHPIIKTIFHFVCFLFTILPCFYLDKYIKEDNEKNRTPLLTALIVLCLVYLFLPTFQAWIF